MSTHDHDHDHHHDHGSELSEMQIRVRALESILTEKGYVDPAALNAFVETYETNVMGTLRVTKALLPALLASGDGHIITVTSIEATPI